MIQTISGLLTNYLSRNLRALGSPRLVTPSSSRIGVVLSAHARIARVRAQAPVCNKCKNRNEEGCRDDKSAKNEVNKEGSRVICNQVPTSFQAHRVTYDSRPFLVHLVFADLSSLHPSLFPEMIFTLVNLQMAGEAQQGRGFR